MSITWNGVSSDTIGVIVERIPNRYVPTRRFSPQQVAGRNGNILLVDKSFPNVEQEYEVYLSAEAQGLPSVARACAEWLMGPDGYCRLEDSYDTTVYREAFLMGGYDLENILNKFGRCTITFSCKPQKYLLTGDTPIEIPAGITTYTGDVVQFDGVTGASITSLSTTITPTQDLHGYSSPWPAGGGANKFDGLWNGASSGWNYATNYIPITAGESYFLGTPNLTSGYVFIEWCDSEKTFLSTGNARNGTVTAPTGASFARLKAWYDINVTYVSFNYPSTVTTYSPYSNICPISGLTGLSVYVGPTQDQQDATTYAFDWTSEAGTVYGGTLDVVTGVLTVDKAGVDMGTLNWFTQDAVSHIYACLPTDMANVVVPPFTNRQSGAVCSIYPPSTTQSISSDMTDKSWLRNSQVFYVRDTTYSNVNDFKAAVARQTLVYELATPLTYQLTPQEVEVLIGTNNVWSSSGDVSVTVVTPLGGIVTNPTPFEARPMLEVSGVGEITINGKTIQILEAVSDFNIDCESMEAEDNSKIYCIDFPELSGGENEIAGDGSITALTVTPRWWTL